MISKVTPILGEQARARDIGFKGTHRYIWLSCPNCGKERWVQLNGTQKPGFTGLCLKCKRVERDPQVKKLRDIGESGLSQLYQEQQLSAGDIAKQFGVAPSTVRSLLIVYGIPIRSSIQSMQIKRSQGKIKYPRGADSPFWRGGRMKRKDGVILVRIYPDSPFFPMANARGFVSEHRLVMARKLGRCLLPWEQVHHIDGVKDHNGETNLELISPANHTLYKQMCARCSLRKEVALLRGRNEELTKQLQGKLSIE